jgi:hypothetical protein
MSTPRTDEAEFSTGAGMRVTSTFARQLERELTAAKADLDREIQARHRVAMETRNPLLAKLEALSTELAAANSRIRMLDDAFQTFTLAVGHGLATRDEDRIQAAMDAAMKIVKAKETRP